MKKSPKTYEVEDILRETFIYGKVHYLIKWKGYGLRDCTWEPIEHLKNVPDIIHKWKIEQIAKLNTKQKHGDGKMKKLEETNQKQKVSKQQLKRTKEGDSVIPSVEQYVPIFKFEENFQRSRQKRVFGKQNKKENAKQKKQENDRKRISQGKIRQSQLKNVLQCFLQNEEPVCRIELQDGRKVYITKENLAKIDPQKLHKFSSLPNNEKV